MTSYIRNLGSVAIGRQPSQPLLFSYYVTHRCNLDCLYCSDGEGESFKQTQVAELTTAESKKLITMLSRSADALDITGGEPMLREDLEVLLAHAQEVGMSTVLNTKAIGLKERSSILRYTDTLVISVDALDSQQLAGVIGGSIDTAEHILESLRFALEERRGTRVVLSAVATPKNLAEVKAVLGFAAKNNLGFHLSPELAGTQVNPELMGNDEYIGLIEEVLAEKAKGTSVLGIPEYLKGLQHFRAFTCYPLLMPAIRPDGHLYYPCLEKKRARVSIPEAGSYEKALGEARRLDGRVPSCKERCHIFCHMALSLLQRHPLSALRENGYWNHIGGESPQGKVLAHV